MSKKTSHKVITAPIQNKVKNLTDVLGFNFSQFQRVLNTVSTTRSELLKTFLDGTKMDINFECNYPNEITPQQYREMYNREGLGKRVVCALPEESWAIDPEVYEDENVKTETEFEKAWKELVKKRNLFHYLERVDKLSGIGRFGVLLLGVDDGKQLSEPLEGITDNGEGKGGPTAQRKLLYLRTFDESVVSVQSIEGNVNSPRYGQPVLYEVKFEDRTGTIGTMETKSVHWTRIIHVADNRETSEVYGTPRLECLYNRLYDLRKILSGSGEMFWKGAFPGYSIETNPDVGDAEMDLDSVKEELEKYQSSLQRFIALTGVTAKSLAVQVADPKGHVQVQMDIVAIAMGVPKRILFGSEEAKLASSTDAKTWNKRLARRQEKYLSPMVIQPFINRLIEASILPAPKEYQIEWPDLNTTTEAEQAQVAALMVDALSKYVAGGVNTIMPPLEFFTIILGMEKEEAEAIIEAAEKHVDDTVDEAALKAEEKTLSAPADKGEEKQEGKTTLNFSDKPTLLGGAGSGNFGHSGIPGQVGGSASGGGGSSGNEKELKEWSKGSVYADKQFHHFTREENVESIKKNGLREADGLYGTGVYLTASKEGEPSKIHAPARVDFMTKLDNVKEFESYQDFRKSTWGVKGEEEMDPKEIWQKRGFDALSIKSRGYLIVLDPSRVKVIN